MKDNIETNEIRVPEGSDYNLNRLQQKLLEVRWVQENPVIHHGFNNSICFDVEHEFTSCYAVSPPISVTLRCCQSP